ncbi:hypothetical protein ACIRRH_00570 [Kitasatospora sp. NPDC101235]|uniref:hypothetical protein n=1 Tax=Kitasatospora sp. NPDC101235 TaxID=3364101 RepID=UPI00382A7A5E
MNYRTTTGVPAAPAAGASPRAPFGLTRHEIRAEARRLAATGWQLWELHRLFGHPRQWGRPWT